MSAVCKSFVIIGPGAVGLSVGNSLVKNGCCVTFVGRSPSSDGRVTCRVDEHSFEVQQAASAGALREIIDKPDCVLLTTKINANQAVIEEYGSLLCEWNVPVLIIQNGLPEDDAIVSILPRDRILVGTIFIGAERCGQHDVQTLVPGRLVIGQLEPGAIKLDLMSIVSALNTSQLPTRIDRNYVVTRWNKLVWNGAFNSITGLHQRTCQEVMRDPTLSVLCETALQEGFNVAEAVVQEDLAVAKTIKQYLKGAEAMTIRTSMLVDRQEGRAWERKYLIGELVRQAKVYGIDVPTLAAINRELVAVERGEYDG